MSFKLKVGDVVEFRVKLENPHLVPPLRENFVMQGRLLSQDERNKMSQEVAEAIEDGGTRLNSVIGDVLMSNVVGWRGQRLVLDDNDQPAVFSPEALDCMLSLIGAREVIAGAYVAALGNSATPEARRGN